MHPHTTVFCLHYLGGSAREWGAVARHLDPGIDLVALDLPGFGEATEQSDYAVEAMAQAIGKSIRSHAPKRWLLVGHSMGAKVAAVLARQIADGQLGIEGLMGLVFLAGSPPGPEPMTEEKRATLSGYFQGDAAARQSDAERYVADNVGAPLDQASQAIAVDDVLRANRNAWLAWLQGGSKEDWANIVGDLSLPALIITGSADAGLGYEPQHRLSAPHFANLQMVELTGAGHLLPLERPIEVARLIGRQSRSVSAQCGPGVSQREQYQMLISSERVGQGTRQALLQRAASSRSAPARHCLNEAQFAVLECLVEQIIPRHAGAINLADRIDQQLTSGLGDGWRPASLPIDVSAYRLGLETLDIAALERSEQGFCGMSASEQDELLQLISTGRLVVKAPNVPSGAPLDPEQMKLWFADVRADATRLYVAHPDSLARIGYSGIANGGDGMPKSGFVRLGPNHTEAWEPRAIPEANS